MKKAVLYVSTLMILTFIFSGCQDDDENPEPTSGNVEIRFHHFFNGEELVLFDDKYVTENGDTINIEEHKYIISNIKFLNPTAAITFEEKDSYHLIKVPEEGNSDTIVINDVHIGTYTTMEFMVGLDSAMNFAPESAPKLFLDEGMFWEWNTGYKFFVLEGRYFPNSTSFFGLVLHVGDQINLIKKQWGPNQIPEIKVVAGKTTIIDVICNVDETFKNPQAMNVGSSSYRDVMTMPISGEYRTNYRNGYWSTPEITNP